MTTVYLSHAKQHVDEEGTPFFNNKKEMKHQYGVASEVVI